MSALTDPPPSGVVGGRAGRCGGGGVITACCPCLLAVSRMSPLSMDGIAKGSVLIASSSVVGPEMTGSRPDRSRGLSKTTRVGMRPTETRLIDRLPLSPMESLRPPDTITGRVSVAPDASSRFGPALRTITALLLGGWWVGWCAFGTQIANARNRPAASPLKMRTLTGFGGRGTLARACVRAPVGWPAAPRRRGQLPFYATPEAKQRPTDAQCGACRRCDLLIVPGTPRSTDQSGVRGTSLLTKAVTG